VARNGEDASDADSWGKPNISGERLCHPRRSDCLTDFADLEKNSLEILREARQKFKRIGVAWSTGKDSMLCSHLMRKITKESPIIFVDTYVHFAQTYHTRNKLVKAWNLNLHVAQSPVNKINELYHNREECCHYHKTKPFLNKIRELNLDAIVVGIRKDEHESRSNETIFSERENHYRIHPILDWTWQDVIEYTKLHKLPINPLYAKGYTSIGCEICTKPNPKATIERGGRSQDKEKVLTRLRQLGYM